MASKRPPQAAKKPTYRFAAGELREHWNRLHQGDREPFPDPRQLALFAGRDSGFGSWAAAHGGEEKIALGVQDAWREFHAGEFQRSIELGSRFGPLGASAANKATAIWVATMASDSSKAVTLLQAAAERGEGAVKLLPHCANTHYMLALVLGRYGQRVSIARALAQGLGGRLRTLLERALELEPRHAEAHIAFGLYHAEIIAKLGALGARLTYRATRDAALEHFERAHKLAPHSPIGYLEHAHALLLLDSSAQRMAAQKLYAKAAACEPRDAMEQLDVERAQRGLN